MRIVFNLPVKKAENQLFDIIILIENTFDSSSHQTNTRSFNSSSKVLIFRVIK